MADLKKKIVDILFEDDPEDKEYTDEDAEEDGSKSKTSAKESSILAKDILYRKSGQSAFINLDEKPKKDSYVEETNEVYEMSSQISPIFGVIKQNKPKVVNVDHEKVETLTNKPADSHLDIITSPIYGYGNKEDAIDNNYEVKDILVDNNYEPYNHSEDDELRKLFDNEEDRLNQSYDSLDTKIDIDEEITLFRLFGDNK